MTSEALRIVISGLFSLIGILLTAYAVPWLKSHTSEQQRKALIELINAAVTAAQQTLTDNAAKKNYVIKLLSDQGVDITDEVNALVESAVYALKSA